MKLHSPFLQSLAYSLPWMDMNTNFQPGQIVSLEHSGRRLYAEVIQVVTSRQLCWVRPLVLVILTEDPPLVTDLRDVSDLLWSVDSFELALDTEVIGLLSQVLSEPKPGHDSIAKGQLNQFIHQIWQAQKSAD